jgi:hypothetical protein
LTSRAAPPRSAPLPGEILASDVAERLGLTAQAIGQWTIKPGAPVRRDGTRVYVRYPEFARWREQELARQAAEDATRGLRQQLERIQEGDPAFRKLQGEARKIEIEVELLERSVVRTEDALGQVEKLLTDLRAALVPFPRTAASKLIGAKSVLDMEQRLHAEVVRLMDTLAAPVFGRQQPESPGAA